MLKGDARDAEDMGDIGDGYPLAAIAGVQSSGKHEGILKTRRQGHRTPPRGEPWACGRAGTLEGHHLVKRAQGARARRNPVRQIAVGETLVAATVP